jgi:hypothetical protein
VIICSESIEVDKSKELSPGNYIYPFKCQIPKDLPGNLDSKFVSFFMTCLYSFSCDVILENSENLRDEIEFNIVNSDCGEQEMISRFFEEKIKWFSCFDMRSILAACELEKSIYFGVETVDAKFTISTLRMIK